MEMPGSVQNRILFRVHVDGAERLDVHTEIDIDHSLHRLQEIVQVVGPRIPVELAVRRRQFGVQDRRLWRLFFLGARLWNHRRRRIRNVGLRGGDLCRRRRRRFAYFGWNESGLVRSVPFVQQERGGRRFPEFCFSISNRLNSHVAKVAKTSDWRRTTSTAPQNGPQSGRIST